jgi:hypothetical protein
MVGVREEFEDFDNIDKDFKENIGVLLDALI